MLATFFNIEAILLVVALSIDAFVASFAYGTSKIKVPILSTITISVICSSALTIALIIGSIFSPYLDKSITNEVFFVILFLLGIIKLFDSSIKALIRKNKNFNKEYKFCLSNLNFILNIYANPEKADVDSSKLLSVKEAVTLAIALSLDGVIAGFGAGLSNAYWFEILTYSFIIGTVFIMLGHYIGQQIAKKITFDISWMSGLLLVILAFLKLFW